MRRCRIRRSWRTVSASCRRAAISDRKPAMTYESILFELSGGIARLTLNRPDKLNSFTAAMHDEVADVLARVEAEGARVLVITGAGRGFCAGQDLNERQVSYVVPSDMCGSVDQD